RGTGTGHAAWRRPHRGRDSAHPARPGALGRRDALCRGLEPGARVPEPAALVVGARILRWGRRVLRQRLAHRAVAGLITARRPARVPIFTDMPPKRATAAE